MTPRTPLSDAATLLRRLRALSAAEVAVRPPPHVEAAVMAAWDAAHAPVPAVATRSRRLVRVASGVAAGVVAASAFSLPLVPRPSDDLPLLPEPPISAASAHQALPALVPAGPASIPADSVAIAGAPGTTPAPTPATLVLVGEPLAVNEPVRVIRMRVAGSTLAAFGIQSLSAEPPESVDLDLLVGEDGVARAVRLAS